MKSKIKYIFIIFIYFSICLCLINDGVKKSNLIKSGVINVNDIIEIPKINLHRPLSKADDDFKNLDNNLVYYKWLNPNDKIIIFGHSGTGYDTFFNRIDELSKNDVLYLHLKKDSYKYMYKSSYIISKYDVYILNNEINSNKLLLVTCYKKDRSKRLVVEFLLNNN